VRRFSSWIAGLRLRITPCAPHGTRREAGMLATVSPFNAELDEIGEMDAVSCWRLRHEDCRHYQHRLALHLQEQINQREDFEQLLARVLAVHVR